MQESIVVQYVNQPKPGKKKGSIKSTAGKTYGVWPDKLDQFQPGGSYTVEVEENQFNGQTYYGIKRIIGAAGNSNGAAPAPAPQSSGGVPPALREMSEAQAERIYVCGILNAWVANAAYESTVPQVHQLVNVTNAAREAWRQTFGGKPVAPKVDPNGPDDGSDVPF